MANLLSHILMEKIKINSGNSFLIFLLHPQNVT